MSRKKWEAFLRGEDVGVLVAPLIDKWCLDEPYRWPYEEPEPYQDKPEYNAFREQLAMAGICGYDPLFYVVPPFVYSHNMDTKILQSVENGRKITETRIQTPYGDMVSLSEVDLVTSSSHVTKPFVETEEDYPKFIWTAEQEKLLDKNASIAKGRELLAPAREKGMIGTWWMPPEIPGMPMETLFYHMADYPDLYKEAIEMKFEADLGKLETLREMGFDFLFYIVPGTESHSPSIFEEYVMPYTEIIFKKWRSLGGFIVWHTCGHAMEYINRGYYNIFLPDILETLSERPVGNLPSLKWAREKLDPRIATKGNIDLQLIRDGEEESLRSEVRRMLDETKGYRHIIGGSDNILQDTPAGNLRLLVDEARR